MNQKYCADEVHKTTNNLSLELKKDIDEFILLDEILESIKKNNEAIDYILCSMCLQCSRQLEPSFVIK